MQTKRLNYLKFMLLVTCCSLPLTSTSHADKALLQDYSAVSVADHHYAIYRQILCDKHDANSQFNDTDHQH